MSEPIEENIEIAENVEESPPIENQSIVLQLGDVIRLEATANEVLNGFTFIVDYIDSSLIKLINIENYQSVSLTIHEDGTLGDGTIQGIVLIYRNDKLGYARQHDLLPETWVNVYFGGDMPAVITGEIRNLEEDMIEIKTYPDDDVIYLNFGYKGLPLDLPIETIEIRERPEIAKKETEGIKKEESERGKSERENSIASEEVIEKDETAEKGEIIKDAEFDVPIQDVKDQVREFILKANEITFGEDLGPIVQYEDVDPSQKRFNLEMQTNDLLDELLSTIPNNQRTTSVLNNIHVMIQRFKQLRMEFSDIDAYGNILSPIVKGVQWKPLMNDLLKFKTALAWLLPVAKNVKKVYNVNPNENTDYPDIISLTLNDDLKDIRNILNTYKSNDSPDEQNKYITMMTDLNPYFTPFEEPNPEFSTNIIYTKQVEMDITAIIDNLTDFESSIVQNDLIQVKKFLIQKYNLGLNRLDVEHMTGSKMITRNVRLTTPDAIALKSVVTLPEPVIRYSRISLPSTNILERADLNFTPLNYWQLLNEKTNVKNIIIDSLDENLQLDEQTFINAIKNYTLVSQEGNNVELYTKFLNTIVPKTRVLFNMIKKYIHGKLSVIDVVGALEPFLIYMDDITFKQYEEINKFIADRISAYNKRFVERNRDFSLLKRFSKESERPTNAILKGLIEDRRISSEVFDKYGLDVKGEEFTNSETLLQMTKEDCSRLYDSVLSLENLNLMIPENISRYIEADKEQLEKEPKDPNVCKTYVIAKQYKSVEELEADNDQIIFFDKKFDNTQYSILDAYERDKMTRSAEDFREFLIEKLVQKHGTTMKNAESLADTLLQGVRRVENGQYAIIHDLAGSTDALQMKYFKRENNRWKPDTSIEPEKMADNESLLCNFQENCIEVTKKYESVCEPEETNKKTLAQNALKEILGQFDRTYQVSKEKLEKLLNEKFEYYATIFDKAKDIEIDKKYRYNLQQFHLGLQVDEEELEQVVSPYRNIRDIILGQQDFVKKQTNIVTFAQKFTRVAVRNTAEDPHWRYCIETNTKLLPSFLYELAGTWCENPDNYPLKVEFLKKEIGAKSDDGDSWVDKYSGYVIVKENFDIEEGYEQGRKAISRDLLEEDAGNAILKKFVKYDNPMTRTINNIINAVSMFMGIQIEEQKEFIVKVASKAILLKLPSEKVYKERVEEMAKKGKSISSYKDTYNLTVLYLTLGTLLIGIQTSIPGVRTRKTFPGCVRSFDGYPFQGNGDFTALRYLSCVVYKIRNKSDPWSALVRSKEESIFEKLKAFIDEYLVKDEDVVRKIQEKTEYILSNPPADIPKEYELTGWLGFLPPLVRFKLKPGPQNISDAFKKLLMQDFKSGARVQRDKILVIESKIIQFSLGVQEQIQNVVDKKVLLLANAANNPFLENACCNEKENRGQTVIEYFEKNDKEIKLFNDTVKELSHLLYDIHSVTKAPFFISKEDTKIIFPTLSNEFNEDTIYQAFIVMCRFNNLLPIPTDLMTICIDKPGNINTTDSIGEKIRKLKQDNRNYTNESMLRLLQIVSRNNRISIHFDKQSITLIQRLRDVLEKISHEEDDVISKTLVQRLESTLDTFEIGVKEDSEEMRSLKNYLSRSNTEMKTEILDFLGKNGSLSRRRSKELEKSLEQIFQWETSTVWRNKDKKISDDATYNTIQFTKDYIQNFIKTFPKIILDKVDHQNVQLPKYWGLSKHHMEDIRVIISDYYSKLRTFYNNKILQNVLEQISIKCNLLLMLCNETPYLSEITFNGSSMHSIFDKRTIELLMQNYFLQILIEYKKLSEDRAMVVPAINAEEQEDLLTVEELEDRETGISEKRSDAAFMIGEQKQLRMKVAELLISFLSIMEDHKDTIDLTYDRVMDLVFKTKEKEKDTFTDRLQALTDEERDADTILKINKLGVWSKGLQKGLTTYVKETYDEERDFAEKLAEIENAVKRNKDVTDGNVDQFMEDYLEETDIAERIDQEEYNMAGLTEDYMDGDYFGQEEENFQDYD
jgi:hypothetical protein